MASEGNNASELENLLNFSSLLEDDIFLEDYYGTQQQACKREEHYEHDDEFKELRELPPSLRLRLTITPSLVQQIEEKVNGGSSSVDDDDDVVEIIRTSPSSSCSPSPYSPPPPCQEPLNKVEKKLKAVHLPVSSLAIGCYLIEAQYPAHLVAKFYFSKRKLVWEILDKGLKHKIEIQWENISAIQATIQENKPGHLELELDRVPFFYGETTPQPKKHTVWSASHDFTGGYASKYRRHSLQFPAGVLDQHYVKLLQLDRRLLELSQTPFPRFKSCYFDSYLDDEEETATHIHFGHHNDLHAHHGSTTPNQAMEIEQLYFSSAIKEPTSFPSSASAFDLPQQVQLYHNNTSMPLTSCAITESSTPLSYGNCSPTNEEIKYQLLQDHGMYGDPFDIQHFLFYQQCDSLHLFQTTRACS
ncbi:hypothetical protein PIB30_078263 [Stylosanthes scabra]|uniref:TRF2/HOY1 PH-like domain-containing protein n=2 Tax=Stylosanthes scabra TaxID=79078 RepID=A0ABU6ZPJ2_9FABA|nr:hypothetical protein [Stylosanthes scabra]